MRAGADRLNSSTLKALDDIVAGLFKFEFWAWMGWLDVKHRYRRTVLGPFWNSATLMVYTVVVGIVGAGLFNQNIHQYLPYLASGMIVWTLVSNMILESCTLFVSGHALFAMFVSNTRFLPVSWFGETSSSSVAI